MPSVRRAGRRGRRDERSHDADISEQTTYERLDPQSTARDREGPRSTGTQRTNLRRQMVACRDPTRKRESLTRGLAARSRQSIEWAGPKSEDWIRDAERRIVTERPADKARRRYQ